LRKLLLGLADMQGISPLVLRAIVHPCFADLATVLSQPRLATISLSSGMSSIVPSGRETITVGGAPLLPVPPTAPALPPAPTAPALFTPVRVDAYSLAQSRANALIIGDRLAVMRVLGVIWPSLKKSIRWVDGNRLSLPLEPGGTLILEEGDRLSDSDQADLLEWLNDHGPSVRVLTTASRPLFPLVEAGSFLDSLYYRLNHVVVAAR